MDMKCSLSLCPLQIIDDTIPEPPRQYSIWLLADSVRGGARLGQHINSTFILADSDDMYGSFNFLQNQNNFETVRKPYFNPKNSYTNQLYIMEPIS